MPNGMTEGIGTFAVCQRTIDFSLMGLNVIANGVTKFTHHTVVIFLRNWNCFVTVGPINRFYILTAAEGR